jgi:hypothetical protein
MLGQQHGQGHTAPKSPESREWPGRGGVDGELIFCISEAWRGHVWPGDGSEVWRRVELSAPMHGARRRGDRGGSECGGGSGCFWCLL